MKKTYWLAAVMATALLFGSGVYAKAPNRNDFEPAKTRVEAIERTKARLTEIQTHLAKLEKMTDQEWMAEKNARQEKRRAKTGGAGTPATAPAAAQ